MLSGQSLSSELMQNIWIKLVFKVLLFEPLAPLSGKDPDVWCYRTKLSPLKCTYGQGLIAFW